VFAVAEHFKVSPCTILKKWSYPLFLDAIERLAVVNEIESRKAEAMDNGKNNS
tara:strand:+ start:27448 stop:27606 length:159 start_codon:yes stop_codon:yes gene_type:complete